MANNALNSLEIISAISEQIKERIDRLEFLHGHIYVISSDCKTKIKIGLSKKPSQRVKTVIRTSGGGELCFLSCLCADTSLIESAIHKSLDKHRTTGEWFSISPNDVTSEIEAICNRFEITADLLDAKAKEDRRRSDASFEGMWNLLSGGSK